MSAVAEPPPSVGSALPPSTGEISASSMMGRSATPPPAAPPAEAPKPVTPAMTVTDDGKKPSERMFESLRSLAKDANAPRSIDEKREAKSARADPKPEPKAEEATAAEQEMDYAEAMATSEEPPKPAATPEPIDKKKVNPWKVIDEHKKARATLEAEVADLKKVMANPELRKQEVERLTTLEKRNQELEEKIKFVDYRESSEFQEKYQKPYEAAWERAMSELKELTVTDPNTGDERAMSPADLLELVNMPLLKADEMAEELYGRAASTVMQYRKEIKGLYDQQARALTEAKKSGVEKHKKDSEAHSVQMQTIQTEANQHWEQYSKAIIANPNTGHYFKPTEGKEDWNKSLENGYKFVDETVKMHPMDPKLTPAQRQDVIKRHISLRARAAAFGRVRLELEATRKDMAALQKKLSQFESTVPATGGDNRESGQATMPAGGRMSTLMESLKRIAK